LFKPFHLDVQHCFFHQSFLDILPPLLLKGKTGGMSGGHSESLTAVNIYEVQNVIVFAHYRQWEPFFVSAIERLLSKHFDRIIDLGAGHSHYQDHGLFQRVRQALAPYHNIVLVLPSPDLDLSVQILKERSLSQRGYDWIADGYDFIAHWVKDRCNHELATLTVYTQDKTPQQTCDEILQCVTK
jgi:hypothetical protein